jgi:UDP-N-acetylmuramate dehydrogenase
VRRAQRAGLSGLEGLLGVPAVLGGAVAMNAGTRFGELSDTLQEVELFLGGELMRLPADALNLSYRHAELPAGAIVTRVRLRLTPSSPEAVQRSMIAVDAARAGQPKVKSAGCAFKNPPGDSAGRIIDLAGLKGLRVGDAMVAHEHGNFVLNLGNATCADVEELLTLVKAGVPVPLEMEWRRWGC